MLVLTLSANLHASYAAERTDLLHRHNLLLTLAAQARAAPHPDAQTVLYLSSRAGELKKLLSVYDLLLTAPAAPPVRMTRAESVIKVLLRPLHSPTAKPVLAPVLESKPVPEPVPESKPVLEPEPVDTPTLQPLKSHPPFIPLDAMGSFGRPAAPDAVIVLPPGLPVIGRAGLPPPDSPTPAATPAPAPSVEPSPTREKTTWFYDPIREEMVWELPARKAEILAEARQRGLIE